MVHLEYVENPFTEKMMMKISDFNEQKSFYDCIRRKFLEDQSFQNLEYTFHMYLLVGDSNDWIGYVLFSNQDKVSKYYEYSYQQTILLLDSIRSIFDANLHQKLQFLYESLRESKNTLYRGYTLQEIVNSLKQLSFSTSDFSSIDNLVHIYEQNLMEYLYQLPNYFYLDVVIALPEEETLILQRKNQNSSIDNNLLVEEKYYGFIRESLSLVSNEIKKEFHNIPIILKSSDSDFCLNNPDDKQLIKK